MSQAQNNRTKLTPTLIRLGVCHLVAYLLVMAWVGVQEYEIHGWSVFLSNYWKVYTHNWFWLLLPLLQIVYVLPWIAWNFVKKTSNAILFQAALWSSVGAYLISQWINPLVQGLR